MDLKPNSKTAARLVLIAAAVVSVAACSSRPKPSFPTKPTGPSQPVTPPTRNGGVSTTPTGPLAGAATPGSTQDFVVNVGDRVLFDFDMYEIRSDAAAILDGQAVWLKRYPSVRVRVEGNTDELGTREYNLALGAQRANAVRDYLVGHGVTSDRISTVSYGKEQPVDTGASDEAHARNRNGHTAIISGAR